MPRKVAITIAGAVSLGAYEAGVMFEVLDALGQHNSWADAHSRPDERIDIDVLTGASAGGTTAAIASMYLLFKGPDLGRPYDNPLYNAWVRDIDIASLLAREPGDDPTHSLLSSEYIASISRKYLTQTAPSLPLMPHGALSQNGLLRLGLALSNLNGVDYARPTMSGGSFTYTQFADQYLISLELKDGYVPAVWETIRATAVSCGAFPVAFSVQDLARNFVDYTSSPFLVKTPWNGRPSTNFCYTDGGVFQNEPLGMAKNLVEQLPGGHLDAPNRAYLYIAPKPKSSDAVSGFSKSASNFRATIMQLAGAVLGQAEFRDWALAESVNDKIRLLDQRANQLVRLFQQAVIAPAQTMPLTDALLSQMFKVDGVVQQARLSSARTQLRAQYATEYSSFTDPIMAGAWLDSVLVLELAANLHEKEEMYIYDFVAEPALLAGGTLFAFTGFFDLAYRQHDYDYGRSVARQRIQTNMATTGSIWEGLQWVPQTINAIDPTLNNIPMQNVDSSKRKAVYGRIMEAVDALFRELGANWLERKAAEAFLIRSYVKKMLAL